MCTVVPRRFQPRGALGLGSLGVSSWAQCSPAAQSPRTPAANTACHPASTSQKEEYHTHLAVLYLEEVLRQRAASGGADPTATETQTKLRRLLQKSDLYRVHFLIGEGSATPSP